MAVIDARTSMGHRWNDSESGNPNRRKSWCIPTHISHGKPRMDWPVVIEKEILDKVNFTVATCINNIKNFIVQLMHTNHKILRLLK